MKVVDFDEMYEGQAEIHLNGNTYILNEPNIKQWAEYLKVMDELPEDPSLEEIASVKIFMIDTLLPEVEIGELEISMFETLATVCQMAFNGNIKELGKKQKPLNEIVKEKQRKSLASV